MWVALLILIGVYWWQLYVSHQHAIADTQEQARLRASQTAQALAYQSESMFRKLNFVVQHLGEHWRSRNPAELRHVMAIALESFPQGAILEVLVADAHGQVVFSSQQPPGQAPQSVARRDFFQAHKAAAPAPRLHISRPEQSAASGQWTLELSRPILNDTGTLAYVVAVAVSVEHLSEAFQQVFTDPQDVVTLLDDAGYYLTRSHHLVQAMGQRVPGERDFLRFPDQSSGNYEARAAVDDITRYYAWQRIPGFPLVLSLGLGRDKVMAPLQRNLRLSQLQNTVATILLLLAAWQMTRLALERIQQRHRLEVQHLRLVTLMDLFQDGVLLEDASGHVVMANAELCQLLNLSASPAQLQGIHHHRLLQCLSPQRATWLTLPQQQQRQSLEVTDDALGRHLWLRWLPIVRAGEALGQIWLLNDMTERKLKEQELATLASTDVLTGLPNRRSFLSMLEQHLAASASTTGSGAVLALDVDHFKQVNDRWGHPAGDLVLQHVTQLIRQSLRASDYPGRLGGEEFSVLVRHATVQEAVHLAERIRQTIADTPTPVGPNIAQVPGGHIPVTISIGVVGLAGKDSRTALAQADKALYEAKATGRNRVCLFQ